MKPCHSSLSNFKLVSNGKNLKLLKSLSNSEATGIAKISGIFLKIAAYAISPSLTYIFKNLIVSSSFFSEDWKIARVFLLLKIGPKTAPDNYRPISMLPVITQVTEKSIYVKVVGFEANYRERLFLEAWHSTLDPNAGNDHIILPEAYKGIARA